MDSKERRAIFECKWTDTGGDIGDIHIYATGCNRGHFGLNDWMLCPMCGGSIKLVEPKKLVSPVEKKLYSDKVLSEGVKWLDGQ